MAGDEPPSGTAGELAYATLAGRLRHGIYPPGSRLLGERSLAAEIGVSRSTLRQALSRLAEEGVLDRSSQRGWFVPRAVVGEPPSVLLSFTEMARARGLRPTARVIERRVRPASLPEAATLRIAPTAPVLALRRVRGMDEMPVCIETTVLVAARTGALVGADLEDASLYDALLHLCGISVARSSYAVQALPANSEEALLIGVAPGSPVLVGTEVTYDLEGTPVLTGHTTYRGDAYRFQADLYRPMAPAATDVGIDASAQGRPSER